MPSRFTPAFTAAVLLALSACATEQRLSVNQLYQSRQCPVEQQTLRRLNSQAEIEQLMSAPVPGVNGSGASVPDVDFANQKVFLVAWGHQKNAGYTLELVDQQAEVNDGIVELPVAFGHPSPDKFYAQMITSPCLIVALPDASYEKIVAGDLETSSD